MQTPRSTRPAPGSAEDIASVYGLTARPDHQFAVCELGHPTHAARILVEWCWEGGDEIGDSDSQVVIQACLFEGRLIQSQHLPDCMIELLSGWGERIEAEERADAALLAVEMQIDAYQQRVAA